jgi:hypothetical protein
MLESRINQNDLSEVHAYASEVVEFYLLLPLSEIGALEALAVRKEVTVGVLIRRAVYDFLSSHASVRAIPGQSISPRSAVIG